MFEDDTVKLLRECDAGVKMGVTSIEEVLERVEDAGFKALLTTNRNEHEKLDQDLQTLLHEVHDQGKKPNPMARGMSWMKTNMALAMDDSDQTIAELMTDGCNMGVKSLSRYLNEYKAADEKSKSLARRLISLEEQLSQGMRGYL